MLVDHLAGTGCDLGDGDRLAMVAAVCQRRVGLGHLQRGDAGGAQGERGHVLEVGDLIGGVDAHAGAHVDDLLVANGLCHLHVAGVGRDRRGGGEGAHAVVVVAVVAELGAPDLEGRGAVEQHVGAHAGLDGGGKREGFERGARGAARQGVVHVVLVRVIILTAHHGLDVAGLGVDHNHAHLELVGALGVHALDGGLLGSRLQDGIDGGLYGEAALEDHVGGELLLQQRLYVVDKVGVGERAALGDAAHVEGERLGLRGVALLLGDLAVGAHAVQNCVAALDSVVGVDRGVVARRGVGQAHKKRRLGQGEVLCGLAQVGLRGGLDAVGAMAVVDGVEVHHQDLFL